MPRGDYLTMQAINEAKQPSASEPSRKLQQNLVTNAPAALSVRRTSLEAALTAHDIHDRRSLSRNEAPLTQQGPATLSVSNVSTLREFTSSLKARSVA